MAEVVTTGEARDALHRIAQRDGDGDGDGDGEPVYFGSHPPRPRRDRPVEVWEHLLEQAEDEFDTALATDRLAGDNGRRLTQTDVTAVFDRLRRGA